MSEVQVEEPKLKQSEPKEVHPKSCPVCNIQTSYVYVINEVKEGVSAMWYKCQCGVIFQEDHPVHDNYNEEYAINYAEMKECKPRMTHAARIYAPLIEELTYGRQILDVGYCVPHVLNYYEDRGWIPWGIDNNASFVGNKNMYKGNFLEYDFNIPATTDELRALADGDHFERKFDLIWMSHIFEHFNDPIAALRKSYNLLSESGCIYIATPDIDFINKTGVSGYGHWKAKEHYTLWSEKALQRELERAGFKIVMSRRNFSSRFSSWYDIQIIAQKNYF